MKGQENKGFQADPLEEQVHSHLLHWMQNSLAGISALLQLALKECEQAHAPPNALIKSLEKIDEIAFRIGEGQSFIKNSKPFSSCRLSEVLPSLSDDQVVISKDLLAAILRVFPGKICIEKTRSHILLHIGHEGDVSVNEKEILENTLALPALFAIAARKSVSKTKGSFLCPEKSIGSGPYTLILRADL